MSKGPLAEKTDFLVIGSGIAGLYFALKAAETGTVAIITKKEEAESNTNYAQGGIASVMSADDSFDSHIADTLNAGAGLCHRDAVEAIVREGPERIGELLALGVEFTMKNNRLDLGREGGHSKHRIVHVADLTGREVERALLSRINEHPNIQVFENHAAIDLITEHHLVNTGKAEQDQNTHCWGAYVLDVKSNTVKIFLSSVTMLATGGAGQVYLHTTNPLIATGDGVAMAYRAGARIGNMEFIQFHPTTLFNSGSPSFLISEAVRGFGGILRTRSGEDFMKRYDSRGSLAPRDIVARAIDSELKRSGDECVFLDVTQLQASEVKSHFPNIYHRCLDFNIDITTTWIPVVPAAHYSCGGVVTDLFGSTSIIGLFACGEVSMTGVHGANRLASNSLLEALVFSTRAAEHIKKRKNFSVVPEIQEWDESGTMNADEWVLIAHDRKEIQQIMWDYVGIVRSNHRLERANRRIQLILEEVSDFYKRTVVTEGLIELRNLARTAELIIRSALQRKESRGLHFTTDYPQRNDIEWSKDTIINSL
ncbi:MAG: L-aspartate oxidase [Bacteroidota bacterium]|nr:L-aspartate oxidase [Bacteroidota bacterium]